MDGISIKDELKEYGKELQNSINGFSDFFMLFDNFTDVSGYRNMSNAYCDAKMSRNSLIEGVNRDAANTIAVGELFEEADSKMITQWYVRLDI